MKSSQRNRSIVAFLAMLLCFAIVLTFAVPARASGVDDAASPILFGDTMYQLVSNRSRMIQISMVAVAFGCALLWWKK